MGNASNYSPLSAGTVNTVLAYTATAAGPYLSLNANGGHPGRAAFQATAATGGGRPWATFAIAAFQVPSDGIYSISDGYLVSHSPRCLAFPLFYFYFSLPLAF